MVLGQPQKIKITQHINRRQTGERVDSRAAGGGGRNEEELSANPYHTNEIKAKRKMLRVVMFGGVGSEEAGGLR